MKQLSHRPHSHRWASRGRWFERGVARRRPARRHEAPRLEQLEDRTVPTLAVSRVAAFPAVGGLVLPANGVNLNGTLLFAADDGTHGNELWKSDGTAAGTTLVKDINPGPGSSIVSIHLFMGSRAWVVSGGTAFFGADDGSQGSALWKSDGTAAGTVMVKDFTTSGPNPYYPVDLTVAGNTVFFGAGGFSRDLWKTDGTADGTVLIKSVQSGSFFPSGLTAVGNTLYFRSPDPAGPAGNSALWKSDGTAAGTVLVKDISASYLTNFNGTLYFNGYDSSHGDQLWKSDGTEAGTVMVTDFNLGPTGFNFGPMFVVGNTLFFPANDGTHGVELWKSDGTAAGTVMVKDINPGTADSGPANLTNFNGTLFFSADDGTHGNELWTSDGTADGTVMVADINPGAGGSSPGGFAVFQNTLFFSADDGTHGRELWKSDGTAGGTVVVADVNPGAGSSNPSQPVAVGNELFFAANGSPLPPELWVVRPVVPGKVGVVRPAADGSATLSLDSNGDGTFDAGDRVFTFGQATDRFLAGDWAGNGVDSVGVTRPTASGLLQWTLDSNSDNVYDGGDIATTYGVNGDTPVAGHWIRLTARDLIGIVRQTGSGALQWVFNTSGGNVYNLLDRSDFYGANGDTPIVGDWTGSGTTLIGVVRPTAAGVLQWTLNIDGSNFFRPNDATNNVVYYFGANGDIPVVGDWNGDGKSKIGVVRPGANGVPVISLDANGDGAFDAGDSVFSFGLNGDKFFAGRWEPTGAMLVAAGGALDARVQAITADTGFSAAVNRAIDLWAQAGLDARSVAWLHALDYGVAPLPGAALGLSSGSRVVLSDSAAGYGWSEGPAPAAGRMDLVSALAHEVGHSLGLEHSDAPDDVMAAALPAGERRAPTAADVDALFAALGGGQA